MNIDSKKTEYYESTVCQNTDIDVCEPIFEVSNGDNEFEEGVSQNEVFMEQVGFIVVTDLLEPTIFVSEKQEPIYSMRKPTKNNAEEPRIIQRERRRVVNINPTGKNAQLDWREELRQRERTKRTKKYGLVTENQPEKGVKSESTNEDFGPGYKPPEKSHVFDWRSCLSNTRDQSVSSRVKNEHENKANFAKYIIPPPATPREKWKLLDKFSSS